MSVCTNWPGFKKTPGNNFIAAIAAEDFERSIGSYFEANSAKDGRGMGQGCPFVRKWDATLFWNGWVRKWDATLFWNGCEKMGRYPFLEWLGKHACQHGVQILAYCLMTNHIHLVAVPAREDSLQLALKPLHMRYAQHINRQQHWSGHLWQGRFFSSPLDEAYLWFCVRYVEQNPVRAGIVKRAEEYPWSSAAGHCGLRQDRLIQNRPDHWAMFEGIVDWAEWLAEGLDEEHLQVVRRNTQKNLPCGSETFVRKLAHLAGQDLRYRPVGRPRKG